MRAGSTLDRWTPTASALAWTALAALGPTAALLSLIRLFGINDFVTRAQSNSFIGSLGMIAIAAFALFGPGRARIRHRTLAWVVGIGGLLVALAIVWNFLFMAHYEAGGTGHIFRRVFLSSLRAPFYGFPMNAERVGVWMTVALSAGLAAVLWHRPLAQRSLASLVAILFTFQIALTCALALAESPERPLGVFSGYAHFSDYASNFEDGIVLLREWVSRMHTFKGFGNHYPAGIPFLLRAGGAPESIGLVKSAFVLAPALTIFPLLGLARELGTPVETRKMIALVFATSASLLIFPTLTPTPALMLPGTMAFWMLVRGVVRGSALAGAAMGLWVALFAFCSFAIYMVALPMACFLIASIAVDRSKLRAGCIVVGSSLASFTSFFVLVWLLTGFDMLAAVQEGIRLTIVALYVSAPGFILRNTGCLLAYLVSVGIPLATLALLGVGRAFSDRSTTRLMRVFVGSIAVGVLLGASTGRTWLETERVWLFYSPFLALLGGWELGERVRREGETMVRCVIVAALCFAGFYGLVMRHHF